MKERYQMGFVDIGGLDKHINQGNAQEMSPMRKQTVEMVISEFGRKFKENGTRGTDHGHGSVYWVLSGALGTAGGTVAGEQQTVERRIWP